MRKALSIVLAGLLVVLPVEQVRAQPVQQEALSVQQTAPQNGAARLFRVSPLTENSGRHLRTSSHRAHLDRPFAEPSLSDRYAVVGWSDWSNKKRVVVFVAGLAAVVLLVKILCPDGCGFGSPPDGP